MRVKCPVRKPCPNSGASSWSAHAQLVFASSSPQRLSILQNAQLFSAGVARLSSRATQLTWQRNLQKLVDAVSDPEKKLLFLQSR
ncbi:hypothetical protein ACLKA7_001879 [Drosophila subpalustris]